MRFSTIIGSLSLCTVFVIISFLSSAACFAQMGDDVVLQNLRDNTKLKHSEEILAGYSAGLTEIAVIVTLRSSAAANDLADQSRLLAPEGFTKSAGRPFYNLRDKSIKKQLKDTVRKTVADTLGQLDASGIKVIRTFQYQFGFAAEVTPQALERIAHHPEVVSVSRDRTLEAHLAQGIPLMNAATPRSIYDGSGLSIAVCDTGIDTSHPMLGGGGFPNAKVIGGYDVGDDDADPRPDSVTGEAHGTACAGISAGNIGVVGDYIGGVAPGAKLYAIKISPGDTGSSSESAMIAAWEWALDHQDDDPANPIMVINTSFGGGSYSNAAVCDWLDYPSNTIPDPMAAAAANAVAAGITIFASSGNEGYCNSIAWPACISDVISVGAIFDGTFGTWGWCVEPGSCTGTTDANYCAPPYKIAWQSTAVNQVAVYSNSAPILTLLAPSNDAYTTDIVGVGGYDSGDYVPYFGGTSAASPYAAGAAAVFQHAAKEMTGSFMSPAQVKQYLVDNGINTTDSKVSVTKPRIDLQSAIEAIAVPVTFTINAAGTGQGVVSMYAGTRYDFSFPEENSITEQVSNQDSVMVSVRTRARGSRVSFDNCQAAGGKLIRGLRSSLCIFSPPLTETTLNVIFKGRRSSKH